MPGVVAMVRRLDGVWAWAAMVEFDLRDKSGGAGFCQAQVSEARPGTPTFVVVLGKSVLASLLLGGVLTG